MTSNLLALRVTQMTQNNNQKREKKKKEKERKYRITLGQPKRKRKNYSALFYSVQSVVLVVDVELPMVDRPATG